MKSEQLEEVYNFHDCGVFTPFQMDGDSIIVTFNLSKHLQYSDLKSRYGTSFFDKSLSLIVKVKFATCSDIRMLRRVYEHSKKQINIKSERELPTDAFDWNSDFRSFHLSEQNEVSFGFVPWENSSDSSFVDEIHFICGEVVILKELLIDTDAYEDIQD